VVRQYIGSDFMAGYWAAIDARDRARRRANEQAARAARGARQTSLLAEEQVIVAYHTRTIQRIRDAMYSNGFTESRRGIWRQTMPQRLPPDRPKRTPDEHAALIRRAEGYDIAALGELTDERRDVDDLVVDSGDALARIERDVIADLYPLIADQAAMHREMQALRTLLDAFDPSGNARDIVDLVVDDRIEWIHARARLLDAQHHSTKADIAHHDRALTRAHSRYLHSRDWLEHLRRARPAPLYQLNLAQQQVVIATTNSDDAG
jgi:hypothetical protein